MNIFASAGLSLSFVGICCIVIITGFSELQRIPVPHWTRPSSGSDDLHASIPLSGLLTSLPTKPTMALRCCRRAVSPLLHGFYSFEEDLGSSLPSHNMQGGK